MIRILILTVVLSFAAQAELAASNRPTLRSVKLKQAFIPRGFDDNDHTQLTVAGTLPDSCHRVGPHKFSVDEAKKTILIEQETYYYGFVCLQMMMPFTTSLDIGILAAGSYQVVDAVSKQTLGTIPVLRSTNAGPDDVLYAAITDAFVHRDQAAKTNTLVLEGTVSDRCSELAEVRVQYQGDVIVVQPIMKQLSRCEAGEIRFTKDVELDKDLTGVQLLHVRSLNGQAVNRVVDFTPFP